MKKNNKEMQTQKLNGALFLIPNLQDIINSGDYNIGLLDRPSKEAPRFSRLCSYFFYTPVISVVDQHAMTNNIVERNVINGNMSKVIPDYPYLVLKKRKELNEEGQEILKISYVREYTSITVPNKRGFNGDYSLSQKYYKKTKNLNKEVNDAAFRGLNEITLDGEDLPVEINEGHLHYINGSAGLHKRVVTCCPTNQYCSKERLRKDQDYKDGRIQEFVVVDFGPRTFVNHKGEYITKKVNTGLVPVKFNDEGVDWSFIKSLGEAETDARINESLKINAKFIEDYKLKQITNGINNKVGNIDDELLNLASQLSKEDIEELLAKKKQISAKEDANLEV